MILNTLVGVAQGMQWLHEHNVLHGDLKAANVMLSIVTKHSSETSGTCGDESKQQQADGDADEKHELVAKVSRKTVWVVMLYVL
jgi:serine/threonine protein kinase